MKKIKNILLIIGFLIFIVLYEIWQWSAQQSNSKQLSIIWSEMKKVPISIAYVILVIIILYFLGKLPFFKGIQMQQNALFLDRPRKSTTKEVLATIIFGIILFGFIIGFFAIMLK